MTTETPPAAAKPAAARRPPPPEPPAPAGAPERKLAVKLLEFDRKVNLPGKSFAQAVAAGPAKSAAGQYRLTYYPERRHHLVELLAPGRPAQRKWVHESWASWEPAE